MIVTVTSEPAEINFAPATELEEVVQNVRTILSTIKNSVPLYREFGVESKYLDYPLNIAQNMLASELARVISKYEPRARLKSCSMSGSAENGTLILIAVVEI